MSAVVAEPVRRGVSVMRIGVFGALLIALVASMLFAIGAGRFSVSVPRIIDILMAGAMNPGLASGPMDERIVLLVRLPRVLLAALPAQDSPSAGRRCRACSAIRSSRRRCSAIAGRGLRRRARHPARLQRLRAIGVAFVFGLSCAAAGRAFARVDGRSDTVMLVLAGVVIGALFAALVSLLQFLADPNSSLPAIVFWLMGTFSAATWARLGIAAPGVLAGAAMLWLCAFASTCSRSARRRRAPSAFRSSATAGSSSPRSR